MTSRTAPTRRSNMPKCSAVVFGRASAFIDPIWAAGSLPAGSRSRAGTSRLLDDWTESMGLMLYDIDFGAGGVNRPGFFEAERRARRASLRYGRTGARRTGGHPSHRLGDERGVAG